MCASVSVPVVVLCSCACQVSGSVCASVCVPVLVSVSVCSCLRVHVHVTEYPDFWRQRTCVSRLLAMMNIGVRVNCGGVRCRVTYGVRVAVAPSLFDEVLTSCNKLFG